MRIAQIAPLFERVPPRLYGAVERVTYALTEELVRRGHDVTLFATADSETSARLVPMAETGLRLGRSNDGHDRHLAMLEAVYAMADEFDIIHSHVSFPAYPFAHAASTPTVHTIHGRLDALDHLEQLQRYPGLRLVSVSHSQRKPTRNLDLNWQGTIYNGIRLEHFPMRDQPDCPPYLVFLGRISPVKGPDLAVEVARRAGLPLKIAAKIDDDLDHEWACQTFLPLIEAPGIEFLGEVGEREKAALLGGAVALLFPVRWAEPFGLVMAEAMACGTPVVALAGGAVEEVIVNRRTGFVCRDLDGMVDAVRRIATIDREDCRRHVERHFSARKMADGYESIYHRLIDRSPPHTAARSTALA